jgi:RNA polymerase sigma-70 factor (family 1)
MTITHYKDGVQAEILGNTIQFPGIDLNSQRVEDLMERIIRSNDYSAFEMLFNTMYSPLCQFCLKFVRVREVAEELVSDVFYTIWKNRERIEVTSHRSYLFAAVRNRGFDYLRKAKRTSLCDLDEASHVAVDVPNSQEMMVESELNEFIRQQINSLPKQCRLIFQLSREQGLKYKEIATMLNISVKTVETQIGRALKHLHQSFPSI